MIIVVPLGTGKLPRISPASVVMGVLRGMTSSTPAFASSENEILSVSYLTSKKKYSPRD